MWQLIIIAVVAVFSAGIVYVSFRGAKFAFVKKLARGRIRAARLICFAAAALITCVLALLLGIFNALVCMLHLYVFWLIADMIGLIINKVRKKSPAGYIAGMKGEDPDLAAHFTVLKARGEALYGEPVDAVFGEVPRKAYLESIRGDVENAEEELSGDPVYLTLNLCRVLAFKREGLILSKAEGGEWAVKKLPESLPAVT